MNILAAALIASFVVAIVLILGIYPREDRKALVFSPKIAPLEALDIIYGRIGTFNFVGNFNSTLLLGEPVVIKTADRNRFGSVYMSPPSLPIFSYDPATDMLTAQLRRTSNSTLDPEITNLGAFFFKNPDEMRNAVKVSLVLSNGLPAPTRKPDIPARSFETTSAETAEYKIPNFGTFFAALNFEARTTNGVVFLYSTY